MATFHHIRQIWPPRTLLCLWYTNPCLCERFHVWLGQVFSIVIGFTTILWNFLSTEKVALSIRFWISARNNFLFITALFVAFLKHGFLNFLISLSKKWRIEILKRLISHINFLARFSKRYIFFKIGYVQIHVVKEINVTILVLRWIITQQLVRLLFLKNIAFWILRFWILERLLIKNRLNYRLTFFVYLSIFDPV